MDNENSEINDSARYEDNCYQEEEIRNNEEAAISEIEIDSEEERERRVQRDLADLRPYLEKYNREFDSFYGFSSDQEKYENKLTNLKRALGQMQNELNLVESDTVAETEEDELTAVPITCSSGLLQNNNDSSDINMAGGRGKKGQQVDVDAILNPFYERSKKDREWCPIPEFTGSIGGPSPPVGVDFFLRSVESSLWNADDLDLIYVARKNVKKGARDIVDNPEFVAIREWETFKRELSKAFPMDAEALRNSLQFYKPERKKGETFKELARRIGMELDRYVGGGKMLPDRGEENQNQGISTEDGPEEISWTS